MKKYVFLIVLSIFWALLCPFAAFKILCGEFVVIHQEYVSQDEEIFSNSHDYNKSDSEESQNNEETVTKESLYSKGEPKEILISKEEFKKIITEICPTAIFEEETVINGVTYDNENQCKYINVGNCALSAQIVAERLKLPSLSFIVSEDKNSVTFTSTKGTE